MGAILAAAPSRRLRRRPGPRGRDRDFEREPERHRRPWRGGGVAVRAARRGGAREPGRPDGEQVAPRQRPRGGPPARPAGDERELHDLVPRRLAQRERGRRRDGARPPVRAPHVHADEVRRRERLRSGDGGGGRNRQRDDLLRLHRLRRRSAARGAPAGGAPRIRPDGEPRSAQAPGRDRAGRGGRGAPRLRRGQRRRRPRRAHVQAGVSPPPVPLARHRPHAGHKGGHPGQSAGVLPALLRPEQRGDRRSPGRSTRAPPSSWSRAATAPCPPRRSCPATTPGPSVRPPPRSRRRWSVPSPPTASSSATPPRPWATPTARRTRS